MSKFNRDADLQVLSESWLVLKESARRWFEGGAHRQASSLAFYTLFSLAPIIFILLTLGGLIFGAEQTQQELVSQLGAMVGDEVAAQVGSIIQQVSDALQEGVLSTQTVVGVLALLFGATAFFTSLEGALNRLWNVPRKRGGGAAVWDFIRSRLLALLFVVALSVLTIAVIVFDALVLTPVQQASGSPGTPLDNGALYLLRRFVSYIVLRFGFAALVVAAVYKVLPDVKIPWRDVLAGAMITSFLLLLGQLVIGRYLSLSDLTNAYGAAGSLVALLLWVYYSALVFFFGAEVTHVLAERYGEEIEYKEERLPFIDQVDLPLQFDASDG